MGPGFTASKQRNKDAAAGSMKNTKQLKHEILPHRGAKTTITGGDPTARALGNYSKLTPADASGVGSAGQNLISMANMV